MEKWRAKIIGLAVIISSILILWQLILTESTLQLGDQRFGTTVLKKSAELEKGLSGTESLSRDHAMLFVFPYSDKWGIWMRDMNYAIDIIWLNDQYEIVHLVRNAQPSSYPDTIFKPEKNTRYVIEVISGTIERTGIKNGDKVTLPSGAQ